MYRILIILIYASSRRNSCKAMQYKDCQRQTRVITGNNSLDLSIIKLEQQQSRSCITVFSSRFQISYFEEETDIKLLRGYTP